MKKEEAQRLYERLTPEQRERYHKLVEQEKLKTFVEQMKAATAKPPTEMRAVRIVVEPPPPTEMHAVRFVVEPPPGLDRIVSEVVPSLDVAQTRKEIENADSEFEAVENTLDGKEG